MHFLLISGSPNGETWVLNYGPENGYQPVSNDNMLPCLLHVKRGEVTPAAMRKD